MTDHTTLERIARQIAADSGRDYDARGAKRAHWRKKAARVLAIRDNQPPALITALMRAMGWAL